MGKYYSMRCPFCGERIERTVGFGVMEMRRMETCGEKLPVDIEYDEPFRCPHCGEEINPADWYPEGAGDVVAFFD